MYKIFIVEDDEKLKNHIKEYLEKYDFEVYCVNNFKEIDNEFIEINPDLVLLDINLPYYDGFYFCRTFRKNSNVPIIITSARNTDTEQIMGIELGADDYIVKPFNLQILLVKIKACLRRTYGEYIDKKCISINVNGLTLDENKFIMFLDDKEIELSKNEFKLIKKLLENKNKVVKREELLEVLWDDSSFVDDNTLTVNVTRVKNKLKEIGIIDAVKTKRGVGYVFQWGD